MGGIDITFQPRSRDRFSAPPALPAACQFPGAPLRRIYRRAAACAVNCPVLCPNVSVAGYRILLQRPNDWPVVERSRWVCTNRSQRVYSLSVTRFGCSLPKMVYHSNVNTADLRKRLTSPPRRQPNRVSRTREHLTPDEVERLMTAARQAGGRLAERDALLIMMAYRHGLRASELAELRWDQLDLKARALHVARRKNGSPSTHPLWRAATVSSPGWRGESLL